MADIIKSYNNVLRRNKDMNDGTHAEVISAVSNNITTKFRDAFETFDTVTNWTLSKASGDIVQVDGNAIASSYLVVSKDPLTAGSETIIESQAYFSMPMETSLGLHTSQRVLGTEFSSEFVDNGHVSAPADIAISSIQQSGTTLTVTTASSHNLSIGNRIGIYGVVDSRFNYPSLVVSSIVSSTQFQVTSGPGGTIPSVTAGPFTSGFVYLRSALGYAQNGTSMIFENATATQASVYVRSEAGDALPSGTVSTNHSTSVLTSASVSAISAAFTYAFQPANEYRLVMQADRLQWFNVAVDATAQATPISTRTQVVPDPSALYKFRIRATNNKGLTVPNAQIVTAVKTGTTTATVTTDVAHGLTTSDVVVIYGARDQTNYPNLVTATAVASVINDTQFTIVWGGAVTATTYGGYVARVQGGNLMSSLGALTSAIQSASFSGGQMTLTGSASWSGASVGDYVNIVGMRDIATGASLNCDGAYRVRNLFSTTLLLEPIGSTPIPADFGTTNCGGAIIKRTDLRISFARIFDYERERVEILARPSADLAGGVPVTVQGGQLTSIFAPAPPSTQYFVNSAATTNGALVSTGTSGLCAFFASNIGASAAYVKLYNKATAPTVGTDVPEMIITVPANGQVEVTPGFNGYRFPLGLGIAITGGVADTDTTAVAAGQVKVKLSRTI